MDRKQFIVLLSVPAAIILIFLCVNLYTFHFGQEILLETAPVDPRDLFRGDYVTLRYAISRINLDEIAYDHEFSGGETVYAVLSKKDKFWTVDAVSHAKPGVGEDQVCMKGRVTSSFDNRVSVEWGIESYFVPEGKGRLIEQQRAMETISVVVAVDSTCSSVLKELLINDEPVTFE